VKARTTALAVALAALSLGLLAPAVASAAPGAVTPSGKALVRIDGGTAFAKEMSKGQYRIVVPKAAGITWLGKASGQGTRTGTMTHRVLVAGWSRLGHTDGRGAMTTLTWVKAGQKYPTFMAATVSKPRFTSSGKVTFVAKPTGRLPKQMNDFTININRASNNVRTEYPLVGESVFIDDVRYLKGQLDAEDFGNVGFYSTQATGSGECAPRVLLPIPGINIIKAIVCESLTINDTLADGTPSYVQLIPGTDSDPGQMNVGASYNEGPGPILEFFLILRFLR
jgi:hypothetical protein